MLPGFQSEERISKECYEGEVELTPSIIEEIRFNEEQELNKDLDYEISRRPNDFPRAIPFLILNTFGERFCYGGIKPILFLFLFKAVGLTKEASKTHFHVWLSLTNLFPILGAALSDSYFGKYNVIVVMSVVYLIGSILLAVFSINDLLWDYSESLPFWPVLISIYLIGIGSGGIKPCIPSHGGDQFPPSHQPMLNRFFQLFFWAVNLGALTSGILSPVIKDVSTCFGSKCYFASFGLCALVFASSFLVFVIGSRYYRVIPPPGEFLPWKAIKSAWMARSQWRKASDEKRKAYGHWLNFADDEVGAYFTEEIRLLGKVATMFLPFILFFILYDQYASEWQSQIEHMDRRLFGESNLSSELSTYFNTILIVFLIPILNYFIYPRLRKSGFKLRLLDKMCTGYVFVLAAFALSNILQYYVVYYANPERSYVVYADEIEIKLCDGCLDWSWQLPQWVLLSFGEALLVPSAIEFAYSQVGSQMKASSSSIWLLSSAIGNIIVSILEAVLFRVDIFIRLWLYFGLSTLGFVILLLLKRFYYVYKEDELEYFSDSDETYSLEEIVPSLT